MLTLTFNYHLFQRQLFAVDFFVCALKFNPTHTKKNYVNQTRAHMTMMFDHDVIDDALAARFAARVTELVQNGFGLTE